MASSGTRQLPPSWPARSSARAVTSDEDDRHVNPIDSDALLQIETIEARKSNVEYQAARSKDSWARQEFLCGRECLRLPACAADQRFQRSAHRDADANTQPAWCV